MEIKSNKQKSTNTTIASIINLLNKNMLIIGGVIISIVVVNALSSIPPEIPEPIYDCSSLSKENQNLLTTTITTRLELIKESMNISLSASAVERSDMQHTIKQIMRDSRKEFCKPPKGTIK